MVGSGSGGVDAVGHCGMEWEMNKEIYYIEAVAVGHCLIVAAFCLSGNFKPVV
jgi:hypothetical protein